jgi:Mg-chelatase subunit ChlD
VASWIRRSFESVGLTQIPTGDYLRAMQRRLGGGTALLLLDVSGSMQDPNLSVTPGTAPIYEAVIGARRFLDEAVEALYSVGVILWHLGVAAERLPTEDGGPAYELLDAGNFPRGGTDLLPALRRAHEILRPYQGDRVVAIFGDGALGNQAALALRKVDEMKAENIRFTTRGLGPVAAEAFAAISDEAPERTRVDSVHDLADGIASMATLLRKA